MKKIKTSFKKRKIKNILLIRPSATLPLGMRNQGIAEPLGILYIVAMLKKHKYKVSVFDAGNFDLIRKRADGYTTYGGDSLRIKEAVKKISPDLVGVSCFTSSGEFDLFETCRQVKEVDSSIPIVVGGSHPTIFPQRMLGNKHIDYVLMREGEYRFLFLVNALNENKQNFDFDGIAYRKSNKIIVNPPSGWIDDLDSLPYPARDLVDMEGYVEMNKKHRWTLPFRKGLILATRGCFNSCRYCLVHKFQGKAMRVRSVDNIIEEIRMLKERWGMKDIFFVDNNLNCSKKFMKELLIKLKPLNVRGMYLWGYIRHF